MMGKGKISQYWHHTWDKGNALLTHSSRSQVKVRLSRGKWGEKASGDLLVHKKNCTVPYKRIYSWRLLINRTISIQYINWFIRHLKASSIKQYVQCRMKRFILFLRFSFPFTFSLYSKRKKTRKKRTKTQNVNKHLSSLLPYYKPFWWVER